LSVQSLTVPFAISCQSERARGKNSAYTRSADTTGVSGDLTRGPTDATPTRRSPAALHAISLPHNNLQNTTAPPPVRTLSLARRSPTMSSTALAPLNPCLLAPQPHPAAGSRSALPKPQPPAGFRQPYANSIDTREFPLSPIDHRFVFSKGTVERCAHRVIRRLPHRTRALPPPPNLLPPVPSADAPAAARMSTPKHAHHQRFTSNYCHSSLHSASINSGEHSLTGPLQI
jgi:hypothetical protein